MKQHIFGFALFSFIIASFAFAFAYFYTPPIPQIAEVKQVVFKSNPRYYCRKKTEKISVKVIGSEYLADENKVVSRIEISWNGYGEPPKRLNVTSMFSASESEDKKSFATYQILEEPFVDSTVKIFTLVSGGQANGEIEKTENLYGVFKVSGSFSGNQEEGKITEPKQVTYVQNSSSLSGENR